MKEEIMQEIEYAQIYDEEEMEEAMKERLESNKGLRISKGLEGMLHKMYPSFKHFPLAEKYGLTPLMKERFFSTIANLQRASFVKTKRRLYAEMAEADIYALRVMIKLSEREKYISKGFYESLDEDFTIISKMLSVYIKNA